MNTETESGPKVNSKEVNDGNKESLYVEWQLFAHNDCY